MMERKFSSRCALITSLSCVLTVASSVVLGQPADAEVESLVEGAVVEWTGDLMPAPEPLDPQIFTEISPLIDSPDAVKLPEDQQPAE